MQHFCIEGMGLGQKVDELEKVMSSFFDSVSGDIFNYAVYVSYRLPKFLEIIPSRKKRWKLFIERPNSSCKSGRGL